ncbi:MAG: glycosyltransferase family 2 protein [Epsilonproteobacteria bacterium]|nr:glycosyltransferase family 2 protein [Campylobacterota bacterium]
MNRVVIVIPIYNNPESIKKVVEDTLNLNLPIIVVDDGSNIDVNTLLDNHKNLTILRHSTNQGKGQAILTGTKEAKKRDFEHIITIDADGQHYPSEIKKMLPLLEENSIIIGNRIFKEDVPNSSKFGRAFSNFWIFVETGKWLTDTQSGFRAYPISILDLDLTHNRYDFEIEVIVKHIWNRGDIKEVPIEVYYPPKGTRVSHFDKVQDNIRLSKIHTKLVLKRIFRLF